MTPDGLVTSAAADTSGNLFVGGMFENLSSNARAGFALLNNDGTVDPDLTVGVDSGTQVSCILVQPDGSVLIGGTFTQFGGEMHGNLVRILADSTIDSSFTIGADGTVQSLAMQSDGSVLVGGSFLLFGGHSHSRIARLNADGTEDTSFTASANNEVVSMLVQPDDSVVLAGRFTTVNGTARNHLAKIDASGNLDGTFDPDADALVAGMAMQADGKILIFGEFTTIGGNAHAGYARLAANGDVDTGFTLPANSGIDSMAAQSDGKILVSGTFTGAPLNGAGLMRVNDDGTADAGFTPVSSASPGHLIPDGTGHIYAAGAFTTFAGQARTGLARLTNPTEPSYSLTLGTLGDVTWTLDGSTPVPVVVYFQASADGTTWSDIGTATYSSGGWTLAAASLPAGTNQLRAWGIVPTNGSDSSLIETTAAVTTTPGAPAITVGPASQTVNAGTDVVLSVTATGDGTLTYQWRKDGNDIAGATESSLTLSSSQVGQSGTYTVVVTNDLGSVESSGAVVTVTTPPGTASRLINLSTRALVGTDDNVMIPGFVIAGTAPKKVLIRAVGPTLSLEPYNVTSPLADPQMVLKRLQPDKSYADVASNDEWMDNANATDISTVGGLLSAFELQNDHEAALLTDLEPGQYTVVASGVNNATGVGIVELYDGDDSSVDSQLVNLSNRGFAGVGEQVMIPGFVISQGGPKTLLLRVVGPTLALDPYNVTGTMADPKLEVYRTESNGSQTLLATQDNWGDDPDPDNIKTVTDQVHAFALADGSADAAIVMTLGPGAYTVIGSSAVADGTGIVLVELYVVQ